MESDPLEDMNRSIFSFNETLDEAVVKPVAETYQKYTPQLIRTGISNFFSNLDDIQVVINDLLQLKLAQGGADFVRLALNSTIGIYGLFDVATPLGLEKHDEDFGQTFGYWGFGPGPYIVLPLLGPSSFRDFSGDVVEWTYIPSEINHPDFNTRWGLSGLHVIEKREKLLYVSNIVDQIAQDRYAFFREAYLQQRKNLIYDGNPPMPAFIDDFEEDPAN